MLNSQKEELLERGSFINQTICRIGEVVRSMLLRVVILKYDILINYSFHSLANKVLHKLEVCDRKQLGTGCMGRL